MLEQLNNIKREYEEFASDRKYLDLLNHYSKELNNTIKSFKNHELTAFSFHTILILLMLVNNQSSRDIINVHNNFYSSFDGLQSEGMLGKFLFNTYYFKEDEYEQFLKFCEEIENICLANDLEIDFNSIINFNNRTIVKEVDIFKRLEKFIRKENKLNAIKSIKKFTNLKIYMTKII